MSFGGELLAALPAMRGNAESRFTETVCFFTEVPQTDSFGETTVTATVLFDDVPARVRQTARDSSTRDVAGQAPAASQLRVDVPVGTAKVGPSVVILVKQSTADAGLVGTRFLTKDAAVMGQVTAWRYPVEAVS